MASIEIKNSRSTNTIGREPMVKIEEIFLLIMFSSTAIFSSSAALFSVQVAVDPVVDPVMVTTSVLFENVALRSACAVGSVMGALLSILLFPCMSANALREMSAKFLASLISGVLFTPVVMRTSGLVMDLDHVVACSGAIAFFSVTVLHKSLPMLESTLGAWFQRQFERMFGK